MTERMAGRLPAEPGVTAVLLDLYDTLVWPDWRALQAGRDALAAVAGVEVAHLREQYKRTHQARMRGSHGDLQGDLAAVLHGCGLSPGEELLRELGRREYANWAGGVHLYPDVLPNLARLRAAGYRLALVSNASREAASVVHVLGLDQAVDALVVSCEVGTLKPKPDILRMALEQLGAPAERALLVDDVPANLDAARALGLATALIVRDDRPAPEHAEQHALLRSLDDLWEILDLSARRHPGAA